MNILQVTGISLFWLILGVDCILIAYGLPEFRYYTKGLLMPVLILFMFLQTGNSKHLISKAIILITLLFCWAGDLFLITIENNRHFTLGLICYVAAQLGYFLFFYRLMPLRQKGSISVLLAGIGTAAYGGVVIYFLWNKLGGFQWPVAAYVGTSCLMLFTAVNSSLSRKLGKIPNKYFIPGALFFVISDTILAFDYFVLQEENFDIIIIITYAIAQFLLVSGATRFIKNKSAK